MPLMAVSSISSPEDTTTLNTKKWEKVVDKEQLRGEDLPLPHGVFNPLAKRAPVITYWLEDSHTLLPERILVHTNERERLKRVFVLDNVLTKEECQYLVNAAEALGFSFWDKQQSSNRDFRSASTIEIIHSELADWIWSCIKDNVISEVTITAEDEEWEIDMEGTWVADGVYAKLLFARYVNGEHFGPHSDGSVAIDINYRTMFPLTIYLNQPDEGGATVMVKEEQRDIPIAKDSRNRYTAEEQYITASISPVVGRVLGFYYSQMHEGKPVSDGSEKYIIRTDILYKRKVPILNEPNDKEAFKLWQEAQILAEKGNAEEAVKLFRRCIKISPSFAHFYKM